VHSIYIAPPFLIASLLYINNIFFIKATAQNQKRFTHTNGANRRKAIKNSPTSMMMIIHTSSIHLRRRTFLNAQLNLVSGNVTVLFRLFASLFKETAQTNKKAEKRARFEM